MVSSVRLVLCTALATHVLACGSSLNQTSITCPSNRTLLDGVCVSEQVADYVACVRAQGAQLDAKSNQAIAADASYLGAKAGGAAELSETLSKKTDAQGDACDGDGVPDDDPCSLDATDACVSGTGGARRPSRGHCAGVGASNRASCVVRRPMAQVDRHMR
jgi:hypothetical protein